MSKIFLTSDLHFNHANIIKFEPQTRPFQTIPEMNEVLISNWNKVVSSEDTVYVLGDFFMGQISGIDEILPRLNGHIHLIRGNHDIFRDEDYREVGFEQIHGVRVFVDKFILSHIPLHPDCVTGRFRVNVHGHLHGAKINSDRYFNVNLDNNNFNFVSFDEIKTRQQLVIDSYKDNTQSTCEDICS